MNFHKRINNIRTPWTEEQKINALRLRLDKKLIRQINKYGQEQMSQWEFVGVEFAQFANWLETIEQIPLEEDDDDDLSQHADKPDKCTICGDTKHISTHTKRKPSS